MSENNNWKVRTLIASGIIGAVMGILAAFYTCVWLKNPAARKRFPPATSSN